VHENKRRMIPAGTLHRRSQLPDHYAVDRHGCTKAAAAHRAPEEARHCVAEAMRVGRSACRQMWHRLRTVVSEEEAIEAIPPSKEGCATATALACDHS
jgi:hypothetical protein